MKVFLNCYQYAELAALLAIEFINVQIDSVLIVCNTIQ